MGLPSAGEGRPAAPMANGQGALGFAPPTSYLPRSTGAGLPSSATCRPRHASAKSADTPSPWPARRLGKFDGTHSTGSGQAARLTVRYRLMKKLADRGFVSRRELLEWGSTEWGAQTSAHTALREFRNWKRGFGLEIGGAEGEEAVRSVCRKIIPDASERHDLYRTLMPVVQSGTRVWIIGSSSRRRAQELVEEANQSDPQMRAASGTSQITQKDTGAEE